jgi:hypothetical protein
MEILITNLLIQYGCIGLISAAVIDLIIRVTKSGEPFTLFEIIATIITWPVVLGSFLTGFFNDFFN